MSDFICGGHAFREVETFKYLGVLINRKNEKLDINERIQKGLEHFSATKTVQR